MLNCNVEVTEITKNAEVFKKLEHKYGNDFTKLANLISGVVKSINKGRIEFTDEFKQWYADKGYKTKISDFDLNKNVDARIKILESFYDSKLYISGDRTVKKDLMTSRISTADYTSQNAVRIATNFVRNAILIKHRDNLLANIRVPREKRRQEYQTFVTKVINKLVYTRASALLNGKDLRAIQAEAKGEGDKMQKIDNERKYLEKLFANSSEQDRNLLSLFKEVRYNPIEFFNSIWKDPLLSDLKVDRLETTDENIEEAIVGESDLDLAAGENIDNVDETIADLDNHAGIKTTNEGHLSIPLKLVLSTLRKFKPEATTETSWQRDTDNEVGLTETEDLKTVMQFLEQGVNFNNIDTMLESMSNFVLQNPQASALYDLLNLCKTNSDIAYQLRSTFTKLNIDRIKVSVGEDSSTAVVGNPRGNKYYQLSVGILNDLKGSVVGLDHYSAGSLVSELSSLNLNDDSNKTAIYNDIINTVRLYVPTLSENGLKLYLDRNVGRSGVANWKENAERLITLLSQIAESADTSYQQYKKNGREYAAIAKKNTEIQNQLMIDPQSGLKLIDETPYKNANYLDTRLETNAQELASLLEKYVIVDLDTTSANVKRKQTSNKINDNFLTNFMKQLEDDVSLQNYANVKFEDRQYDLSNILLEYTENGVLHRGLFKVDETGNRVPTSYAKDLLKVFLFDGAENNTTNKALLYKEMSRGDYIGSAFVQFFEDRTNRKSDDPNAFASAIYFMRTPSDAPRNYGIRTVKYSAGGLFNITNAGEIESKINIAVDNASRNPVKADGTAITFNDAINGNKFVLSTAEEMAERMISKDGIDVFGVARQLNKAKEGSTVRIAFRYRSEETANKEKNLGVLRASWITNVYYMTGTVAKDEYGKYLTNAKYEGVYNFADHKDDVLDIVRAETRRQLELNGEVKRAVNREHILFTQAKRSFKQELMAMAVAMNQMFQFDDNGYLRYDEKGNPLMNEHWKPDDTGIDVYHSKKNSYLVKGTDGKIREVKETGIIQNEYVPITRTDADGKVITEKDEHGNTVYEATGKKILSGNVFTSDRFTIFDEASSSEVNYGAKILQEAFDILYGGIDKTGIGTNEVLPFDRNNPKTWRFLRLDRDPNGELKNIILTEHQEATIDKYISDFVLDVSQDTYNRLTEYGDIINKSLVSVSGELNLDTAAEFIMNYHNAYTIFNELFEGDTKFYKNVQTLFKRAKESQGSGISYGHVDNTAPIDAPKQIIENTALTKHTFTRVSEDGVRTEVKIPLRNKFTGVTIKNTVNTNVAALESLVKSLMNQGRTEDEARNILFGKVEYDKNGTIIRDENGQPKRVGGQQNVTVNDAQSYITFEEWVRRIAARGQLAKYLPLIDAILDESKPIDNKLLDEFTQVQKNFYYDQYFDKRYKVTRPRQIKNAEFVLIPRFIKGTQLEQVYEIMKDNDIDQLNTEETSKAGKANVLTLWDNDGNITDENLNIFKGKVNDAAELYDYRYLYTQQETKQHVDSVNKAGLQIIKKIWDNIDTKYPELVANKEEFFKLYSYQIQESFQDLCKELEIPIDENGVLNLEDDKIMGMNKEKFFKLFKEQLLKRNADSNLLDYVTLVEGEPLIDPIMSGTLGQLESIANAVFNNNVTRQTLPGFHSAQVTNVGWKLRGDKPAQYRLKSKYLQSGVKNSGKLISKEKYDTLSDKEKKMYINDSVQYSKDLQYHPDGKPYVEVRLSKSYFKFNRTDPKNPYDVTVELKEINGTLAVYKANVLVGQIKNGKLLGPAAKDNTLKNAAYYAYIKYVHDTNDGDISNIDNTTDAFKSFVDMGYIISDNKGTRLDTKKTHSRWHGMSEAEINEKFLKELQKEGLDIIVGYRIPTEGKQSICNMKVVGFIDDSYGSTIVVPDNWVAQTGSDFDIDSVYGIQHNTYIDGLGKLRKIKYRSEATKAGWRRYINRQLDENIQASTTDEIRNTRADAKASLIAQENKIIANLAATENDLYKELPENIQKHIQRINARYKSRHEGGKSRVEYRQQLEETIDKLNEITSTWSLERKETAEDKKKVDAFIESYQNIIDNIDKDVDLKEATQAKAKEAIDKLYSDVAESNGLESWETYRSKDAMFRNSRAARQNRIVDLILDTMSHPSSLEENLSRSQFEAVTDARDFVETNPETGQKSNASIRRSNRSAYNFIDQAENQYDAMAGARLKAISVSRDTLDSVCNTVRPFISEDSPIEITYDSSYNVNKLIETFGKKNVRRSPNGGYIVKHITFGHTLNNRNVEGLLLTPYSSQTTAHALDAVKEGFIQNVNDLTFGVYKMFPDVGSNYVTAVSFMMQPAITRIVEAYNATNSIYSISYARPIDSVIKDIAKDLGLDVNKYTPINKVLKQLNEKYLTPFKQVWGYGAKLNYTSIDGLAFDSKKQIDRIHNTGVFKNMSAEQKLLYDLGVVLQFKKLYDISEKITKLSRVSNPDRFGAKQSVYATSKVLDDIYEFKYGERGIGINEVLQVPIDSNNEEQESNRKSFLDALYPGLKRVPGGSTQSYVEQFLKDTTPSAYPPLNAFLKYATTMSVVINRTIFPTQDINFRWAVMDIRRYLSDNAELSEDRYNDYQGFILSTAYKNAPIMRYPITWSEKKAKGVNKGFNVDAEADESAQLAEERRIRGIGKSPGLFVTVKNGDKVELVRFHIKDVTTPDKEEIDQYLQLSPAQKIEFIKRNFDDGGIFDYIDTTLYNDNRFGKNAGLQMISFNESKLSIEEAYYKFEKAFYNENPLLNLAALDIIKYAGVVEGFRPKRNAVWKIIKNSVLYRENDGSKGTDFVNYVRNEFFKNKIKDPAYKNLLITSYIRAHYDDMPEIRQHRVKKVGGGRYDLPTFSGDDRVVILYNVDDTKETANFKKAQDYGFLYTDSRDTHYNEFVKLDFQNDGRGSVLYKIETIHDTNYNTHIVAYPLSRLNEGEISKWSSNPDNWRYKEATFYEKMISKIADTIERRYNEELEIPKDLTETERNNALYEINKTPIWNEAREHVPVKDYLKPAKPIGKKATEPIPFDLNDPNNNANGQHKSTIKQLKDKIVYKYNNDENAGKKPMFFVGGDGFKTIIPSVNLTGEQSSTQTITFDRNDKPVTKTFDISRVDNLGGILRRHLNSPNIPIDSKYGLYKDLIEDVRRRFKELPGMTVNDFVKSLPILRVEEVNPMTIDREEILNTTDDGMTYSSTIVNLDDSTDPINHDSFIPEFTTEEIAETYSDLVANNLKTLKYIKRQDNKTDDNTTAANIMKSIAAKDIDLDKASIKGALATTTHLTANYVVDRGNKLLSKMLYFKPVSTPDNDIKYLSIDSPKLFEEAAKNPILEQEILKTLVEVRSLAELYDLYSNMSTETDEALINEDIQRIKNMVTELQSSNLLKNAEIRYGNINLKALSDNPLIQRDILSIFDGYHSTSWFDGKVGDLQHNSNALVQVVTKTVVQDVRAKDMLAVRESDMFVEACKAIEKRAKAKGESCNIRKILTGNGRFIEEFNEKFRADIQAFEDRIHNAEPNSLEQLQAKHEFKKWKLEYTHQALKPEYYKKEIELEEAILNNAPEIYEAYTKAYNERLQLIRQISTDGFTEELQKRIDELGEEIDKLQSTTVYNPSTGEFKEKPIFDNKVNFYSDVAETKKKQRLNSRNSADVLNKYLKGRQELREKYFDYDPVYGWEEELQKNLNIIKIREQRLPNGKTRVPITELWQDREYVKAKEWLAKNTRRRFDETNDAAKAYLEKLDDAYRSLGMSRKNPKGSKVYIQALRRKYRDKIDDSGILDARLLSDEELKTLKQKQANEYVNGIGSGSGSTERLIRNGERRGIIYKRDFYTNMSSTEAKDVTYVKTVKDINAILIKHYDAANQIVETSEFTTEELNKLGNLYDTLYATQEWNIQNDAAKKRAAKHIRENVEFVIDEERYGAELAKAKVKAEKMTRTDADAYMTAWKHANNLMIDGVYGPNRYLYSYPKAKDEKVDETTGEITSKWINKTKTKAIEFVSKNRHMEDSPYYEAARSEAESKGHKYYEEWYEKNHVFNPLTGSYEPLRCWRIQVDNNQDFYVYKPSFENTYKTGKKEYIDSEYKPQTSLGANYKKGSGEGEYDNNVQLSDSEKELKELLQTTLRKAAKTTIAKRYLDRGGSVVKYKAKDKEGFGAKAKYVGKQLGALAGYIYSDGGFDPYFDVSYTNDRDVNMPMFETVKSKELQELEKVRPKKEDFKTDEEYKKALKEYATNRAEQVKKDKESDIVDLDYKNTFKEFIIKAGHFNAVEENKYKLFYARNMIRQTQAFRKNIATGRFKVDSDTNDKDTRVYATQQDAHLLEQFDTWFRRFVFDQYKEPDAKFTRIGNLLQSITASQYMALNVRGGIANITVGNVNMLMEAVAKEYLGVKEMSLGKQHYFNGISSIFSHAYTHTASNKNDAIIKYFDIVDYADLAGLPYGQSAEAKWQRVRNAMFITNTAGEHMMQNQVLLGMCESHRVVLNPRGNLLGRSKYAIMNKEEYMAGMEEAALLRVATVDQVRAYKEKLNSLKRASNPDAVEVKNYVYGRKNIEMQFMLENFTKQQKQEYKAEVKKLRETVEEKFNSNPTLYSQFTLGKDGMMQLAEDSILKTVDVTDEYGNNEAMKLLAGFKGRVVSVNKKIHGVYDKLGAAQIEKYWWGGMVMQYHKHIYPGIMKRFRRQGMFNEERGTIERGCYRSLAAFLLENWDATKYKNVMTKDQIEGTKGVQNWMQRVLNYVGNIPITYGILPEREKANIRRTLSEQACILSALFAAAGLAMLANSDSNKDSIAYNLCLYEMDRLVTETNMYEPLGAVTEAKTLWSSPVAVQPGIVDISKSLVVSMGMLANVLIQGDNFDPYYHSGINAGEHKLKVYIERRIPVWRQVKSIQNITKQNKAYKLGAGWTFFGTTKMYEDMGTFIGRKMRGEEMPEE